MNIVNTKTVWVNPLDKVPQVPNDYANHIIYGGLLGYVTMSALSCFDISHPELYGTLATFLVAALKKVVDYFKEMESVQMCVYKAVITALWPFSIWIYNAV